MRKDGAELRLVRRACSRLHLDQIRPHGLEVSSEISTVEDYRQATLRIQSALQVSGERAIAEAAVNEGSSGLRKLVGQLVRVRSPNVELVLIKSEQKLQITFRLRLPAEITFTREIG